MKLTVRYYKSNYISTTIMKGACRTCADISVLRAIKSKQFCDFIRMDVRAGSIVEWHFFEVTHFQTVKSAVASLFFSCSALVCSFSCSYITSQVDLFIHIIMVLPTHCLIQTHTHCKGVGGARNFGRKIVVISMLYQRCQTCGNVATS